jgi:hypothetical protein
MTKRDSEEETPRESPAANTPDPSRPRGIHEMSLEEIIEAEVLRHVVRGMKRRPGDRLRRR